MDDAALQQRCWALILRKHYYSNKYNGDWAKKTMFDNLTNRLSKLLKNISGKRSPDRTILKTLREVRMAL
ncbi:hypothetical protein O9929_07630 [Vibrio lentus]|nr:hypothetical protein [Vibrio lentus]